MSARNLSSALRFNVSDVGAVAEELDQFQQDRKLKNDITSVLHRLELDGVKPGYDVLAQTGFRRGYQVRKRSPGETLIASPQPPGSDRGRTLSYRHSYVEPRLVRQHLENIEHAPTHVERTVRFIEPEPVHRRHEPASYYTSPAWYYTEPRSYSLRRTVARPGENRALSEYRESLVAPPSHQQQQQRWSVYGSAPVTDWRRSQSTPPEFYRSSARVPIGDRLTRRRNHEFAIGVKLAESQTDLDNFNRMLDKRFGGSIVGADRSHLWRRYSLYPSYWPTTYHTSPVYYDYKTPRTTSSYSYDLYSPPSRVTRPSETLLYSSPYSYSDYSPYTSTYSKYFPSSYVDYGNTWSGGYHPGYASYPRSGYYVTRSRYQF